MDYFIPMIIPSKINAKFTIPIIFKTFIDFEIYNEASFFPHFLQYFDVLEFRLPQLQPKLLGKENTNHNNR